MPRARSSRCRTRRSSTWRTPASIHSTGRARCGEPSSGCWRMSSRSGCSRARSSPASACASTCVTVGSAWRRCPTRWRWKRRRKPAPAPDGRPGDWSERRRVDHRRGGNPRVAAAVRRVRRFRLRHLAQTRLWLLPLTCLLAGIGLAVALLSVDRSSGVNIIGTSVTGSAGSVQTILTVASTALVTLPSVVLSLTLVAVQLAMGQFSPRIVRAILHDRRSQLAIGLFIGTFAYSMTVLREVNGNSSGGGTVPGLAVVVDYALILSAIVVLVLYVHHTAESIRVGGLIGWVADATRDEVDRLYPAAPKPEDDPSVVAAPDYGIVTKLPHQVLVTIAEEADCVLELVPAMGDFVPRGGPLFRVLGSLPEPHRTAAALSVILDRERSHQFEPAFGLRKLVDVGARSIYSSPFQDPTTCVQASNAIHDILRQLAPREFPSGRHHDAHGHVRLVERVMSWEGYVRLAFDELRLVGAGSPQVARRLRAALEDLKTVASPERRPPLDRQLELLDEAVRRASDDDADIDAALVPDMQGIGSGPDVMSPPPRSASLAARDNHRPLADTAGARHG